MLWYGISIVMQSSGPDPISGNLLVSDTTSSTVLVTYMYRSLLHLDSTSTDQIHRSQ